MIEQAIVDAFQNALGWDWDAVPAEHVPSGRECAEEVATEVMDVASFSVLFERRRAHDELVAAWSRNERMSERLRRDWPSLARALDRLKEEGQ